MLKRRRMLGWLAAATALAIVLGALALASVSTAYAQGPGQGTPTPCWGPDCRAGMRGGMWGNPRGAVEPPMEPMAGPGRGMMSRAGMRGGIWGNYPDCPNCPQMGAMGSWTPPAELIPAGQPLTLDVAASVAEAYIAAWDSQRPLQLGEVVQFSRYFYAQALETETGRGAFSFLIDPQQGTVIGEPGPNRMWNLVYGRAAWGPRSTTSTGESMSISAQKAVENVQAYLDKMLPGAKAASSATAFYGYYTLPYTRDGKIAGVVSVNGETGQVWLHHWLGDFVAACQ